MSTLAGLSLLLSTLGCVRREMMITSDPPGALVFLNDQEVGRTPMTRPFVFYGNYDVVLRKDGYQTLKTRKFLLAPWWQWVPFDLAAELFPLTDRKRMDFAMTPASTQPADPDLMFERADELRARFTSRPSAPATQPALTEGGPTPPATGPATMRGVEGGEAGTRPSVEPDALAVPLPVTRPAGEPGPTLEPPPLTPLPLFPPATVPSTTVPSTLPG